MTATGRPEPIRVQEVRSAAELLALMRLLKERSGLTFRQLEERAAANGEVLARSTLADTLRRTGLPKPEVLAAFVRACGEGGAVPEWLAARQRLAQAPEAEEAVGAEQTAEPPAPEPRVAEPPSADLPATAPRRWPLFAAAAVVGVAVLSTVAVLLSGNDARAGRAAPPVAASGPEGGPVQIRPAASPELCLTEGRDPAGRYSSAVAVQRPCDRAVPPRTVLEALGGGLYRIRWIHPEFGEGCLTVLRNGAAAGLLEPWDDCAKATRFRIEAVAEPEGGYRIHSPGDGSFCVGIAAIRPGRTAEGTEAAEQPCADDAAGQRFLITPVTS